MTAVPADADHSPVRRLGEPILSEIVNNALQAAANEASATVIRSAVSVSVKEGSDSSCAILDGQGQLLAQSSGTFLGHLSSLGVSLKELLLDYPTLGMAPGDAFIMNDPSRGGIHANDVLVFVPVFDDEDRVVFFVGALIHVFDLGGVSAGGLPAQATERYHEGLLLPPVPLMRGDEWNDVVIRIIELNSRGPESVVGDIRALVAGCDVGSRRLQELIARYGSQRLRTLVRELLDYTEHRAREGIARLPEGECKAQFVIDDDGVSADRSYAVRVAVVAEGGHLVVDFAGTDAQAEGPINASRSQVLSGVAYGVRCFLDPTLPMNEGIFRVVSVRAPENSIVNPSPSAAVNARIITVFAVIDAIVRAMSRRGGQPAVATSGLNHVYTVSGQDHLGHRWIHLDSDFGGIGGRCNADGVNSNGAYLFAGRGSTKQVEAIEVGHPHLRYEQVSLIPDSGGAGHWRGGLGLRKTVRALTDAEVSVRADRIRFPPAGEAGGGPGGAGGWVLHTGDGDRQLASKQMGVRLKAGDRLSMITSGGGGYGPPEQRDPQRVLADVRAGFVSVEQARDTYRVAIVGGPDRSALTIDGSATVALRADRPSPSSEVS